MTQDEIQQKAYEVYPLDLDRHLIIEGEPYDNNKEKREAYIKGLKAGAEWMAGQGETFNGYVSMKGKRSLIAIEGKSEYKFGDKVIVQIRKK